MDALIQRIQEVHQSGSKILLVTAASTYADVRPKLSDVAPDDLKVLDLLSTHLRAVPDPKPNDGVFVPSPTMLEMAAMRVEQIHRMLGGNVHVVVDSLSALCVYNPPAAVMEFCHFLVNRLRAMDASGDLIISNIPESKALVESIAPYADDIIHLGGKK